MSIDALKDLIPDYAKDIKLNLSTLAGDETLSDRRKWGAFLACALACGQKQVIRAIDAQASQKLTEAEKEAAKAAAAIMAMNNIYYKFTGMIENPEYKTMGAKLRMNVLANPGVDKSDFELWSLAVSAVNGCAYCVNAHEALLLKAGVDAAQIHTAVRIAAVVHAASAVLAGEEALTGEKILAAAA